jgi:hypothetical protein
MESALVLDKVVGNASATIIKIMLLIIGLVPMLAKSPKAHVPDIFKMVPRGQYHERMVHGHGFESLLGGIECIYVSSPAQGLHHQFQGSIIVIGHDGKGLPDSIVWNLFLVFLAIRIVEIC